MSNGHSHAYPPEEQPDRMGPDLSKDESELIEIYRKAKKIGFADIVVTVQEGERVKLWLTEKMK